MLDAPRRPRSRTHETRGWWQALRHCQHRGGDVDIMLVEFAGLPLPTVAALTRAGITCQRMLRCMPDFLLRTVPDVGKIGHDEIRRHYPFDRNAWRWTCPGAALEADQRVME